MQDWANPLVRDQIRLYPEITPKVAEFWQAGKWIDEVLLEELTPMWANWEQDADRHFYVGEVARTKKGKYVIPRRWVTFGGEEYAEVHRVHFNEIVRLKQNYSTVHCVIVSTGEDIFGDRRDY